MHECYLRVWSINTVQGHERQALVGLAAVQFWCHLTPPTGAFFHGVIIQPMVVALPHLCGP